jgi:hypothetical protein
VLGFPIRKSSDHSSVDSSPRLIAASYVLHRLLVPRHPPCALKNLATKMLASTVQFSNNNPNTNPTPPQTPEKPLKPFDGELARRKKQTTRERTFRPTPPCPSSQDPTAYLQSTNTLPAHSSSPQQRDGPSPKKQSRRTRHEETIVNRTSQCSTRELHRRTFVYAWA